VSEQEKIEAIHSAEKKHAIKALLKQAKSIAVEYYKLTSKPLGVTGEIAEYEAAEKLGLTLVEARSPAVDAYREANGKKELFQIKGRAVSPLDRYRGRVSKIKDGDYQAVLLVLLDKASLDTIEIWRAERTEVIRRLDHPGSKSRNDRRSMGIAQFKSVANKIWPV
jgi:hypothetical protein